MLLVSAPKMTPSPDPRSDRKRLSIDELIAVLIALSSIGAIIFWSMSQKEKGFDLSFMQIPTVLGTSTATSAPSLPVAPSPSASATATPPVGSTAGSVTPTVSPLAKPSSPAPTALSPQAVPFIAAASQVPLAPSPQVSSVPALPIATPKQFADVPAGFWASVPIAALSAQGILDGFPDGSFQPNKPITRAEFAEMVRRAFQQPASRDALRFKDLKPDYWAIAAIDKATQTRFMSGFPDGSFQPNRQIPRLQVLLALATGLNLQAKAPSNQVLSRYQDAEQIPKYAVDKIAAATEAGLVLNDASPALLSPNQVTTRAEAAALVYEALRK